MSRHHTKASRMRRKAFLRCITAGTPDEERAALRYVGRALNRQFASEEALCRSSKHLTTIDSPATLGREEARPVSDEDMSFEIVWCCDRWNLYRYVRLTEGLRLAALKRAEG